MRKKIAVLLTALLLVLLCAWQATAAGERVVDAEGSSRDAPLCKAMKGMQVGDEVDLDGRAFTIEEVH